MEQERPLHGKAVRFLIVGVGNTAIDFSVFGLLIYAGLTALLANLAAWVVAVVFSYVANANWSFERRVRHLPALLRFVASGALISLLVSSVAVGLLAGVVGLWPAKIAGTIVAAILNFVAARWSIENKLAR